MAFTLEKLKSKYKDYAFFTSDRECIEYLLAVNLQPLEEYALFIKEGKAQVITPHEMDGGTAEQIFYEGYSNRKYQNKKNNILQKLNDFSFPKRLDTVFEKQRYAEYFRKRGIEVRDVSGWAAEASFIKNEEQIKRIEECVEIDEKAYEALMNRNICGETELSAFRYVEEAVMEKTAYDNRMIYDFLAGVRTAQVSGFPSNYRLSLHNTLIADLLPRHKGVYADMTRTYFIGRPDNKQVYIYEILKEALEKAEALLKPGVAACELYEGVFMTFRKYGMEQNFPHHAGHGLGMSYFEAPYFLKEEGRILEENMVVALEPGLYLHDEFGIRIENDYVITQEGFRRLGGLSLELEDYILS